MSLNYDRRIPAKKRLYSESWSKFERSNPNTRQRIDEIDALIRVVTANALPCSGAVLDELHRRRRALEAMPRARKRKGSGELDAELIALSAKLRVRRA